MSIAMLHLIKHSLFYALSSNLYLFLVMVTTSPRVRGYNDYPQEIKDKVPHKEDYRCFSDHYKSHVQASAILVLLCLVLAGIVWLF